MAPAKLLDVIGVDEKCIVEFERGTGKGTKNKGTPRSSARAATNSLATKIHTVVGAT